MAAILGGALTAQAPLVSPAKAAEPVQVSEAWSRPTPPGLRVAVVYLSIKNTGSRADRLLSASTPIAAHIEFHQSSESGGVISMRTLAFIDCPAGGIVKIAPGGLHLMLTGLTQSLVLGSSYPLTLQFRDAGSVSVTVAVEARD